jgi:D-sedoheptulose 7-phosphate isomerase
MIDYKNYIESLSSALENMKVTGLNGQEIGQEEGLSQWCKITSTVRATNATMYFAGNGASAMMASHMAADACKNGRFRSMAFNDAALMTAISNDISYEESFAMPLKRFADPGAVLVTISSSGNSPNIVRSIEAARKLELQVVTLSGMKPNNRSRQMGDINFYIPADTYGVVEVTHQAILHCWLDKFMEEEGLLIS